MKIGDTLPNGAVIRDISVSVTKGVKIILAEKGYTNAYEPFVTWSVGDDPRSTSCGHYFKDLSSAQVDFNARIRRGY